MQGIPRFVEDLRQTALDVIGAILGYLPDLLGALLLVFTGWIAAQLARRAMRRLLDVVNRMFDRVLTKGSLARVRFSTPAVSLMGSIVYWLVIFIFFSAATRVAGLEAFSSWLDNIVNYLPTVFAGMLIFAIGFLLSTFIRDMMVSAAAAARFSQADLFGAIAQAITLLVATVIGLDQIGIDVTFLVIIAAVTFATVLAGFSLAFGLGARDLAANLIAAHYLREDIQLGQRVRIGEIEGVVIELTPTSIVLDAEAGRTVVPATMAQQSAIVVLAGETVDE